MSIGYWTLFQIVMKALFCLALITMMIGCAFVIYEKWF